MTNEMGMTGIIFMAAAIRYDACLPHLDQFAGCNLLLLLKVMPYKFICSIHCSYILSFTRFSIDNLMLILKFDETPVKKGKTIVCSKLIMA